MITKERLEELIEQGATVYDPDTLWQSVGEVKLNKSMKINNGRLDGDLGDLGLKGAMCSCYIPLEDLFENKEDAEFVAKYHTQRVEKFEPPIKLPDGENFVFTTKKGKQMVIYKRHNTGWWLSFVGTHRRYDTYEEAVEKARKLFLGESDAKD